MPIIWLYCETIHIKDVIRQASTDFMKLISLLPNEVQQRVQKWQGHLVNGHKLPQAVSAFVPSIGSARMHSHATVLQAGLTPNEPCSVTPALNPPGSSRLCSSRKCFLEDSCGTAASQITGNKRHRSSPWLPPCQQAWHLRRAGLQQGLVR